MSILYSRSRTGLLSKCTIVVNRCEKSTLYLMSTNRPCWVANKIGQSCLLAHSYQILTPNITRACLLMRTLLHKILLYLLLLIFYWPYSFTSIHTISPTWCNAGVLRYFAVEPRQIFMSFPAALKKRDGESIGNHIVVIFMLYGVKMVWNVFTTPHRMMKGIWIPPFQGWVGNWVQRPWQQFTDCSILSD